MLSKLSLHPNIISYYDSFEVDGTLMIEMEYADGGWVFPNWLVQCITDTGMESFLEQKMKKFGRKKVPFNLDKLELQIQWTLQATLLPEYVHAKIRADCMWLHVHNNLNTGAGLASL